MEQPSNFVLMCFCCQTHFALMSRLLTPNILIKKTTCRMLATKDSRSALEVSSPHPMSNLRFMRRTPPANETDLERDLRMSQDNLQEWNHKYWQDHNKRFFEGRDAFSKEKKDEDLTVYYTKFLEDNYDKHVNYSL